MIRLDTTHYYKKHDVEYGFVEDDANTKSTSLAEKSCNGVAAVLDVAFNFSVLLFSASALGASAKLAHSSAAGLGLLSFSASLISLKYGYSDIGAHNVASVALYVATGVMSQNWGLESIVTSMVTGTIVGSASKYAWSKL